MKTHRIILSTRSKQVKQTKVNQVKQTSPMAMQPRYKVATDYSILDFAGQAQQTKGRLKNINGHINVIGLLVFYQLIFMANLP